MIQFFPLGLAYSPLSPLVRTWLVSEKDTPARSLIQRARLRWNGPYLRSGGAYDIVNRTPPDAPLLLDYSEPNSCALTIGLPTKHFVHFAYTYLYNLSTTFMIMGHDCCCEWRYVPSPLSPLAARFKRSSPVSFDSQLRENVRLTRVHGSHITRLVLSLSLALQAPTSAS